MQKTYITYDDLASENRTQRTLFSCDAIQMEPKDRLKDAREKAGYASPTEAARSCRGINVNTIISNENGNRPISKKMAQVYAEAFNTSAGWLLYGDKKSDIQSALPSKRQSLTIKGEVAAGLWMDAELYDSEREERSNLADGDARYPSRFQYLLRVRGQSLNRVAQDGDLILCVDYGLAGIELKSGDFTVVERSRDGGHTLERTAKRAIRQNDDIELQPVSDDPRYQEPVTFKEHDEETTEVRIIAKILGVIRMLE